MACGTMLCVERLTQPADFPDIPASDSLQLRQQRSARSALISNPWVSNLTRSCCIFRKSWRSVLVHHRWIDQHSRADHSFIRQIQQRLNQNSAAWPNQPQRHSVGMADIRLHSSLQAVAATVLDDFRLRRCLDHFVNQILLAR